MRSRENKIEAVLADRGYCSEKNLSIYSAGEPDKRIEAYVATGRQKHCVETAACPRGPLPKDTTNRAYETDTDNRSWSHGLRRAQGDREPGLSPDQTGPWIPAIFLALSEGNLKSP